MELYLQNVMKLVYTEPNLYILNKIKIKEQVCFKHLTVVKVIYLQWAYVPLYIIYYIRFMEGDTPDHEQELVMPLYSGITPGWAFMR